jgi:anti-sigma regulatory factor (Ser/Thr protein kinase)
VNARFRHDAFLYLNDRHFAAGLGAFIREGLANHEPVLVVVDAPKIDLLRVELDGEAERVGFADMRSVGRNPALILPAWQEFLSEWPDDTAIRGVGEPIWPGQTGPELVESQYHESLLNLAFGDTRGFQLLCPYDAGELEPSVLAQAERNHPRLTDGRTDTTSDRYCGLEAVDAMFGSPLPDPPLGALWFSVHGSSLADLRTIVVQHATQAGLGAARTAELVLAVNEVVTNSLGHAGGEGTLLIWREPDRLVCEVRDRGRISSPLVGRHKPSVDGENGRGLWVANQLCDLVQIRSSSAGSAVRLHMRF